MWSRCLIKIIFIFKGDCKNLIDLQNNEDTGCFTSAEMYGFDMKALMRLDMFGFKDK